MVATPLLKIEGQKQKPLGKEGLETWREILTLHEPYRKDKIYRIFNEGVTALGLTPDHEPSLQEINTKLKRLTGFQGLFVEGLEAAKDFFPLLSKRLFPIGNFIRDKRDLNYTPAPDMVHDLYGHVPFLADQKYADFCQKFGELACQHLNDPKKTRQLERFFWFTIEFGLIKTPEGVKVFGAGIASSLAECEYALSQKPKVVPFDIDLVRNQEFSIDKIQDTLFLLESVDELYKSLPELFKRLRED